MNTYMKRPSHINMAIRLRDATRGPTRPCGAYVANACGANVQNAAWIATTVHARRSAVIQALLALQGATGGERRACIEATAQS